MARRVIVVVVVIAVAVIWWLRRTPAPAATKPRVVVVADKPVAPVVHAAAPVEGLRLEGQVIDADQHPVAGMVVHLLGSERTATSEADGGFAFDGLTAGRYRLLGDSAKLATEEVVTQLTATSEPVILRARAADAMVVTVVDALTKDPLPRAEINDGRRRFTADASGRVRVTGILDSVKLEITAPEHSPAALVIGSREDTTVELARGASVSGTVVAPDGTPVPDCEVEIEGKRWTGHVRCDAHGAWRIDTLAKGSYELTGSSELYTEADSVTLKVDGATPRTGVVVPVELGAQMAGMVVDFDNQPVAGATVHFDSPSYEPITTTSDAAGHFRIAGLPRDRFELWASEGNRVSVPAVASQLEWPDGPVVLAIAPSPFAGIVVEPSGEPVVDAQLAIRVGPAPRETRSDADGHFDFGGIPAGLYAVTISDHRGQRYLQGIQLTAPSSELKIVLPPRRR